MNSSGADQVISTGAHSYSIGEMTLVSTDHSPNLVVTQGVLQPNRNSTNAPSALDEKELASQITVYPNPTSDILYIKPKFAASGQLKVLLTALDGKTILQKNFLLENGTERNQINLRSQASGNYLLKIMYTSKGVQQQTSFKINKIN